MAPLQQRPLTFHTVTSNETGQRIDNFLLKHLKGVPKSLVYRIIRKGEVRVNKKRIKATYKLQPDDSVRIPPIKTEEKKPALQIPDSLLKRVKSAILYEDDALIVVNKPSGLAVHSGSHSELGVIEILRQVYHNLPYLELVHRLDMETSGLLMIATSREMLQQLHTLLRDAHRIEKHYTTLIVGNWQGGRREITHKLERRQERNEKVQVSEEGKASTSIFTPLLSFQHATLMDVQILTGRMHQIRTQLAYLKHPIIGDTKYGEMKQNRYYAKQFHLDRLFLHASRLSFEIDGKDYRFEAPLPPKLQQVIDRLKK